MHIHELMAKMASIESEFKSKHGKAPSQPQLAEMVGISIEKLQMLIKVTPQIEKGWHAIEMSSTSLLYPE